MLAHTKETGHSVTLEDLSVLDRDDDWFRRGVREAVYARVHNPSLNKIRGLRHKLSHLWD